MNVPWGDRVWKRVVVYGLGASGLAATGILRAQGVEVIAVDRRLKQQLDLARLEDDRGVELLLGSDPRDLPAGVDGVVVSPGVPMDQPLLQAARAQGLAVIAEVELGFLFVNGPIIGITGSNGKSTTTALTGALLAAAGFRVEVCGNIGVPLSSRLDGAEGRVFVIELSSFQLEGIDTFRPRAAALLNLAADHLDRHADVETYYAAKQALFRNQAVDDIAVLNADDGRVAALKVPARCRFFSRSRQVDDGCFLDGDIVVEIGPQLGRVPLFRCSDLSLPGPHNLENAMAAALLARAIGAEAAAFATALREFEALPHRLQRVRERHGVSWYDDSKATNFAAAHRSLEGFVDGTVHLILGGRNKGGDPACLVEIVGRKVCRLYLVGEAAAEIEAALGGVVSSEVLETMPAAVARAASLARAGEVVLLSPACASFDQYRSFAERGDHFQSLVRALDG